MKKNIILSIAFSLLSILSYGRKYDIAVSPCLYYYNTPECATDNTLNWYNKKDLTVRVGDTILFKAFSDKWYSGVATLNINGGNNGPYVIVPTGINDILVYEYIVSTSFTYELRFDGHAWNGGASILTFTMGNILVVSNSPSLNSTMQEASYDFDGNATDLTRHNHDGILLGAIATTDRFGNPSGAIGFNSTQYVDFTDGNYIPDSLFSISFWFKLNAVNNNVDIVQFPSSFSNDFKIGFNGNNILKLTYGTLMNNTTVTQYIIDLNTNPIPINTWHHFVLTGQKVPTKPGMQRAYLWGGPHFAVYLNGQMLIQNTLSHAHFTDSGLGYPSNCGYTVRGASFFLATLSPTMGGNGFNGAVDDFSIWNKELNLAEVQALYTGSSFIEETKNLTSLKIYPNPSTDKINVEINANLIGSTYAITDQIGKTVLTGKINAENTVIELGDLSGGVYMFSVGGNKQGFKVIKN